MPPPPDVSRFTRFVLENPWPAGIVFLAVAAVIGWQSWQAGNLKRVQFAAILALIGAGILIIGRLVVTSGEHAERVTESLVNAAVNKDVVGAVALFSDDATLSMGSPTNPGYGMDVITQQLDRLAARYTIDGNRITMLRGYSESADAATVHLICSTTVDTFPYPNITRWVFRVERTDGSNWNITHFTCISINDRTPSVNDMW